MSSFTFHAFHTSHISRAVAGAALGMAGGLVAGGCGSDPGIIDYTLPTTFCQQVAQADCSPVAVQACYGANDATLSADTTACLAVRGSLEHCNPQNLPYHAAYAQPCVDAHAAVYAQNPLDPGALAAMALACAAVFNNGGARGAPCAADTDCAVTGDAAGLSCVIHQGKGTCQTPVSVEAGNVCTDPAALCVTGYSCDAGGHCVQDPGNGGACGWRPCASGLRCDTTTKTCAPLVADGQPCTVASDCIGQFCVGSPGGSVCTSTFTLAVLSPTCSDFK